MDFKSDISKSGEGSHSIRGVELTELMRTGTFTDAVYLLFGKRLPSKGERAFLDVLLVSAVEHGIETPSLYMPRVSIASGNSIHTAIAAGILGIGESHGGAGEAAAELLLRKESPTELANEYAKGEKRIPGFGHKVYKDEDPRATLIFEKAKEYKLPLKAFTKAYAIEKALADKKGKKLPLNIDGAFAAGILSLGLPSPAAKALFVLARVAGMGAHAIEEAEQGGSYKRLA